MSAEAEWSPTMRLVDLLLEEQQSLSLVDDFAAFHDRSEFESGRYEALIPDIVPGPGQQLAFRVDLDGCTGCKACVTACHSLNGLEDEEAWRRVGLIETGGGAGAKPAQSLAEGPSEIARARETETRIGDPLQVVHQQTVTAACHHCEEPACLSGCPVRAYEKDPITGIVRHLDDQCIGCRYCQLMCPYDVPTFSERLGIVRKCDMCHDRLSEGEAPACVQGCPNSAISIAIVETGASGAAAQLGAAGDPAADPTARAGLGVGKRLLPVSAGAMPESRWTAPTTQYVSTRSPALAVDPVDLGTVRESDGHTPLAAMLVLTQVSIGAVAGNALLGWALGPSGLDPLASATVLTLAMLVGLAGLGASMLHLGRPQWAFRAILGLRTSWMSREIVVLGAYAGALVASCALGWLDWGVVSGRLEEVFGGLAVIGTVASIASIGPLAQMAAIATGALGLFCSAKIYAVTRRPLWRLDRTLLRFSMTAIWAGVAAAQFGLAVAAVTAALSPGPAQVALAFALIGLTGWRFRLEGGRLVESEDPLEATALSRTRTLLAGRLGMIASRRRFSLKLAGFALPALLMVGVILALPAGVVVALAIASLALGIASDALERSLFFRAEAMPAMPGKG